MLLKKPIESGHEPGVVVLKPYSRPVQPACPALETWVQLTLLVQSVCLWLALNTLCLDPGTTSPYRDCETPQILSNSSTVTILRPSATLIVIAEPPLWLARNWLLVVYYRVTELSGLYSSESYSSESYTQLACSDYSLLQQWQWLQPPGRGSCSPT